MIRLIRTLNALLSSAEALDSTFAKRDVLIGVVSQLWKLPVRMRTGNHVPRPKRVGLPQQPAVEPSRAEMRARSAMHPMLDEFTPSGCNTRPSLRCVLHRTGCCPYPWPGSSVGRAGD